MSNEFDTSRLKTLPVQPGVYIMRDTAGKAIYIGKAKNLKNRVRSYFAGGDGRPAVPLLVARIASIETIVTQDELQALLLESDLIKKHRPKYNIRLKDDKAYLVIRIDLNAQWPKLEFVRSVQDDGARYIGPFAFSYQLRHMLEIIRNSIPLRTCSDRVIYNRVRPCLEFQMKRCCAPCCLDVNRGDYLEYVKEAISILEGRNKDILKSLATQMEKLSNELRFEEAAEVRDRLEVVKRLVVENPTYRFSGAAQDAFGIYREAENIELSVLSVRRGRLHGAKSFHFEDLGLPDDELLSSLLTQFYEGQDELPSEIILPVEIGDEEIRQEVFQNRRGKKVTFTAPKQGSKLRLLNLAQENARENYVARHGAESSEESALKVLQQELQLEQVPRTIECVDISHFQGGSTVASVVHFLDGKPEPKRYRTFHLASQEGKPDDFASMKEVLLRHLSRGAEENTLCDLIVIDGGPAQLQKAIEARAELSLREPLMIGLAKRRTTSLPYYALPSARAPRSKPIKPERVYFEGESIPKVLRETSKGLHLLERLRDEAHRVAITFHRKTRTRRTFRSVLENIPGVGERRRIELLRTFKSIHGIRDADPQEISSRCSLPLKLAERIVKTLRGEAEKNESEM